MSRMPCGFLGHYKDSPLPAHLPLQSTDHNQEVVFYLPDIILNDQKRVLDQMAELSALHGHDFGV